MYLSGTYNLVIQTQYLMAEKQNKCDGHEGQPFALKSYYPGLPRDSIDRKIQQAIKTKPWPVQIISQIKSLHMSMLQVLDDTFSMSSFGNLCKLIYKKWWHVLKSLIDKNSLDSVDE